MLQHLFEKVWYAQIKVYTVSLGTSVNLDTTVAVSTMVVCQYCNEGSEPKALYGSLVSCADVSYMYSCIQHSVGVDSCRLLFNRINHSTPQNSCHDKKLW